MSRDIKYMGMDVHKEAIVIAVLNGSGQLVMESIVETKASSMLQFIHGLRWPAMDAETTPAFLDFKLVFTSTEESVKYETRCGSIGLKALGRSRNWKRVCECHRSTSHSRLIRSTCPNVISR